MNTKIEVPTKLFLAWAIQEKTLVEVTRLPYKNSYKEGRRVCGNLCLAEPLYACFPIDGREIPNIQFRSEDVETIQLANIPKVGYIWSIVLKELPSEETREHNLGMVRKMLDQLVDLKWHVEIGRGSDVWERGTLIESPYYPGNYWIGKFSIRPTDIVIITTDCLGHVSRIQLR